MSFIKIIRIESVKLLRPANFVLLGLMLLTYTAIASIYFLMYKIESPNADIKTGLFKGLILMESGLVGLFIAIFIIMNIGKEYSDGTLRKNIIDGYTREQFFTGKLWMLLICIFLVFIFGKLVILTAGLLVSHFEDALLFLTPSVIINSFMQLLSIGFFSFFLIFLTRNLTISILVYFLWSTLEAIAQKACELFFNIPDVQSYLPLGSMTSALSEYQIVHTSNIVIASLYIFLMLFTSYYLLLKRDIK